MAGHPALPADYKKLTIDATERLANSGWTLQSEGIQIVRGKYDCSLGKKKEDWYQVFDNITTNKQ